MLGLSQKISPELWRAFGFACGSAFRRGASEIGVEDLVVGLRHAVGKASLSFFETPDAVEELVARLLPSEVSLLEMFKLPAGSGNLSADTCAKAVGYRGPLFKESRDLQAALGNAESIARSHSRVQISVEDVIQALARNQSAQEVLARYGIRLRET